METGTTLFSMLPGTYDGVSKCCLTLPNKWRSRGRMERRKEGRQGGQERWKEVSVRRGEGKKGKTGKCREVNGTNELRRTQGD